MSLTLALLAVLAGLGTLTVGGELLLRGATTVARVAGLTPAVVGLTVVATGTSIPELVVSLIALKQGSPGIAVGNVVGSNIANVALILGVTALIAPLPIRGSVVRVEWPFMFVASCFAALVMRDLEVDRLEGTVFLLAISSFMAFSVWLARREVVGAEAEQFEAAVADRLLPPGWRATGAAVALIIAGVALLAVGGRLLVEGAVALARFAGMTERVIGLTIVAAGTSAPELAASIVAARRGHTDVAVGNIIGSNLFNVLGVLGAVAVVTPIAVPAEIMRGDIWWMLGTSLALFPIMRSGMTINRAEGGVLSGLYALYLWVLLR